MTESCNSPANHRARESWASAGSLPSGLWNARPALSAPVFPGCCCCLFFLMLGSVLMLFLGSTFRGFHLNYVKFHIHKPPWGVISI